MICSGCGAPMTSTQQPGAFRCQYCGASHTPAYSAPAEPTPRKQDRTFACPVCNVALNPVTLDNRYHGHVCAECRGLLFNQKIFKKSIKERRKQAPSRGFSQTNMRPAEVDRLLQCPTCQQAMHTHLHKGGGTFLVDTCQHCKLIWLDHGEYDQALAAANMGKSKKRAPTPRPQRSRPPIASKQLEKSFKKLKKKAKFDVFDLLEDIFD